MIRRPPRSTRKESSAASDVYKRQTQRISGQFLREHGEFCCDDSCGRGTHCVTITPMCRRLFSPWSDLAFLRAGVPLEQVSRHVVVTTDASNTGWGATCNGQAASGSWTGPRLLWHINCLFRTSTDRAVYDHVACLNSPAISSSGVRRGSSRCALSTSQGSSIVQPMRSHDSSLSLGNGDSIPRRSS